MRILVATDAWRPQVNGVVRTYERLSQEAARLGIALSFLTPEGFATVPMPTYPEIRLALLTRSEIETRVARDKPDYIHIATEGPIGLMTRMWCVGEQRPFTTAYHTRFPEYLSARLPVPVEWGYWAQRWFHDYGCGMMVATPSLRHELAGKGFRNLLPWTRGVDADHFRPNGARLYGSQEPVLLYVGRVAVEKGIDAFLKLDVPGRKVVVGGGPQLGDLAAQYPEVTFAGPKSGAELVDHYCSADAFVFPSRTDTFGNVMLEAMACGVPVAAFPVTGPLDIVRRGRSGVLDEDLSAAVAGALSLDRRLVREEALAYSWEACARLFLSNIVRANGLAGHRPFSAETLATLGNRAA